MAFSIAPTIGVLGIKKPIKWSTFHIKNWARIKLVIISVQLFLHERYPILSHFSTFKTPIEKRTLCLYLYYRISCNFHV
jgi:hypothetical protein